MIPALPLTPNSHLVSLVSALALLFLLSNNCMAANVTYDHRSLIIDGQRKLIISTSIHYPRSVPEMWPRLVDLAKKGGANAIETYVFWNVHEPVQQNYIFGGRYDLVKFVKIVEEAEMYLILRIGPFVAAEWNFGGIPIWLHFVPGTIFRTDNEPFKFYMRNFTTFIVGVMKKNELFASQGGPIILAQIENEYGDMESAYGEDGKKYALWAAEMALSQNIGVPWIMCQQHDAPDHVINTCNSFYCDQFTPNSPSKPKFWTESWPGWFVTFGESLPHRPVEDVAYSVALFFQKNGTLVNYYVYHGGTNFGRTSGGPFITTSYDYDAPVDEYGLPRLPKWGHLKDLHDAIWMCEKLLLHGHPSPLSLGPSLDADVYTDSSGGCAAFIANVDDKKDRVVMFRNRSYHIPAWSVSILPDCEYEVFNTAKIRYQTWKVQMATEKLKPTPSPSLEARSHQWNEFSEKHGTWGIPDFTRMGFAAHINTTRDTTDYLWYTTSLNVSDEEFFSSKENKPVLLVESKGHALYVFINQKLEVSSAGNGSDPKFKFRRPIPLKAGQNNISLLSLTVGLQNGGPHYDTVEAGLVSVKIEGLSNGTLDLSSHEWAHTVGLEGEKLGIYGEEGVSNVDWRPFSGLRRSLTWYMTRVDAPAGNDPAALDMARMGKGQAWLNGEHVGRYWSRRNTIDNCDTQCDYRGRFSPSKCRHGCGNITQRWYHVPRSWFKHSGNLLVVLEEQGGDPTTIRFSRRRVSTVCVSLSVDDPPHGAAAVLECPAPSVITQVVFASFGDPSGACRSFHEGLCHDPASAAVVRTACLKRNKCALDLKDGFTGGACANSTRRLAVEATCG